MNDFDIALNELESSEIRVDDEHVSANVDDSTAASYPPLPSLGIDPGNHFPHFQNDSTFGESRVRPELIDPALLEPRQGAVEHPGSESRSLNPVAPAPTHLSVPQSTPEIPGALIAPVFAPAQTYSSGSASTYLAVAPNQQPPATAFGALFQPQQPTPRYGTSDSFHPHASGRSSLWVREAESHSESVRFGCVHCGFGRSFTRPKTLVDHHRNHHTDCNSYDPYQCCINNPHVGVSIRLRF